MASIQRIGWNYTTPPLSLTNQPVPRVVDFLIPLEISHSIYWLWNHSIMWERSSTLSLAAIWLQSGPLFATLSSLASFR